MRKHVNIISVYAIILFVLALGGLATGATAREGAFRVVEAWPRGKLRPTEIKLPLRVVARFSQEVIARKDVGSSTPVAIVLERMAQREGRWRDERTYELLLAEEDCVPGREISWSVDQTLRDAKGRSLTGERSFSFVFPPLELLAVRQVPFGGDGEFAVELALPYPVGPAELLRHVSASSEGKTFRPLRLQEPPKAKPKGGVTKLPTSRPVVVFESENDEGSFEGGAITLTLAAGLRSLHGGAALETPLTTTTKILPAKRFLPLSIRGSWRGEVGLIKIEFSDGLALDHAAENVSVDPPAKFTVDVEWGRWSSRGPNVLVLKGDFKPETRYKVTLKPGLRSSAGQRFGIERLLEVWLPKVSPFVALREAGGHLSPTGTMKLRLRSSGIAEVTLEAWRLYDNNLVYYVLKSWEGELIRELGAKVGERTIRISSADAPTTTYVDLREFLTTPTTAGVFLVRVVGTAPGPASGEPYESEDGQWQSPFVDEAVIVLSNLGVVAKQGRTESVVWVTALDTAQPVAEATVTWYSSANQVVAQAKTDTEGVARAQNLPTDPNLRPRVAVVRAGNDTTYIDMDDYGNVLHLPPESTLSSARRYLRRGYEAFVTTDREVYRPGERIHLAGFVRGVDAQPPRSAFPLELALVRPDRVEAPPMRLLLSPTGAFETSITLAQAMPTGMWSAIVRLPGSAKADRSRRPSDELEEEDVGELGRLDFLVEEVLPVRLEVSMSLPEQRSPTSEPLQLALSARELFGQPASGRPCAVKVLYKPEPFANHHWPGYVFGDPNVKCDRNEETLFQGSLDDQGELKQALRFGVKRAPAAVRAEIQAVVWDASGRAVTKRESRVLDPVAFYIGAKLEGSSFVRVGEPLTCSLVAVRPDEQLAADVREVSATVARVVWDSVLRRAGTGYTFAATERLVVQAVQRVRMEGGRGEFRWEPPTEGQYVILLEALEGGARTRVEFYASPQRWSVQPWSLEKPEELVLVPDKPAYRIGEVARLLVKAPFTGTLFVSLEQDRVTSTSVHQVDSNTAEIALPIDAALAPNVFVAATLVRPVRPADKWLPHRAFGALNLPVRLEERKLSVSVEATSEVRPLGQLDVTVKLADPQTSVPVEGDVILWAVDEGLLALTSFLTPDPWAFFYAPRRLGVKTADFYADLMPDVVAQPPSAPGGGDDGFGARRYLSPVAAERIRPVVLWSGVKRTDEHGCVRAALAVPQYTGRLRVMAAAAAGARFGAGEAPTIVRGPVAVREHFPRFLAPGDEARAPIVLYNNTEATTQVRLTVWARGPVLLRHAERGEFGVSATSSDTTLSMELTVPAMGTRPVDVLLEAARQPGVATLGVVASVPGWSTQETLQLPVRPAAVVERIAGRGVLRAGETVELPLARAFMAGTTTGSLALGGSRQSELLPALRYNLRYPYGCLEQIISASFPLLAMRDFIATFGEDELTSEGVVLAVAETCEQLSAYQRLDGGLAMWPGGREPWLWGSLYAAHFMLEARRTGVLVPEESLEALLKFIRREATFDPSARPFDTERARECAYAAYVLALAQRPSRDLMELLYDRRTELPVAAAALLAAAYWQLGMPKPAHVLLDLAPDEIAERELGRTLASPAREGAILLATLVDVDPQGVRPRALAERLYDRLAQRGHWGTTQDNAFALWALARYERAQKGQPSGQLEVLLNGRSATVSAERGVVIPLKHLDEPLKLRVLASGEVTQSAAGSSSQPLQLHYSWVVEGVPAAAGSAVANRGLKVMRSYAAPDKKPLAGEIRQGKPVLVTIDIQAERALQNVVIVDLLPACLEVENPKLATSEQFAEVGVEGDAGDQNLLTNARVDIRDDRVIFFLSELAAGVHQLRYTARAVSAGRFVLGPVSAECMYDPDVFARSESREIRVIPRSMP